jgi:hypothetical protein
MGLSLCGVVGLIVLTGDPLHAMCPLREKTVGLMDAFH